MTTQLLRISDVATRLNVSTKWVREHKAELGALRIGHPDRGQLRFDPDQLARYIERRRLEQPTDIQSRRKPGPRRGSNRVELIPLPKEAA